MERNNSHHPRNSRTAFALLVLVILPLLVGRWPHGQAAQTREAKSAENDVKGPPVEPVEPVPLPKPKPRPPLPPEPIALDKLAPQVVNSLGMKLSRVPSGSFFMGSHEPLATLRRDFDTTYKDFIDEYPQHRVFLSNHFYMGTYEVTQEEYEKVMGDNPSAYSPKGYLGEKVKGMDTRRFPVEHVTWNDAVAFCKKLSARPPERERGRVYRLPTEAEWEYACRGGGERPPTRYFSGASNSKVPKYGWFERLRIGDPHKVGELEANPFGLYDMMGNVPEWCQDVYSATYYRERVVVDPPGPPETAEVKYRVLRFGPRSSERLYDEATQRRMIGFRVVFSVTRPEPSQP